LYQEWIELDLFRDGLKRFSAEDFKAAGLNAADRDLIEFMAEQEVGHATMISNILGAEAPQQCA
jgi:rubrerythrin